MKYIFELTSKVQESESHIEKHHKVIEGLKLISEPWGIDNGEYPTPEFGSGITATFSLNRLLKNRIKGDIIYGYRKNMTIQNEDKIFIEFNPKKIDYVHFIENVFKKYIFFFNPFEALVYNQNVIFYDYENRNQSDLSIFFRFHPIFFWDAGYCMRNLRISLVDFKAEISGFVEYSELFQNGIIVVVNSKLLTLQESNEIDLNLKAIFSKALE